MKYNTKQVKKSFLKERLMGLPIRNWALAVNQFAILFDKRVPIC